MMRIVLCALTFFLAQKTLAQESLIASALESKKSLVHITALQYAMAKSPQASAVIDPRSGRMLVAQKAIAAQKSKTGAGVIISADGLIVTNYHTIKGAEKIAVHLYNDQLVAAKILSLMPQHDLALLKIESPITLTPIKFANSNHIKLKDPVLVIGNSQALKETLSAGRIIGLGTSHMSRQNKIKSIELIEVNIDLHQGDSGGPLLDRHGDLIGMIAAEYRKKQSSIAIPSNKIKKLYLDFIN